MSKYGVFSAPYFPVFGLNKGKYGREKTPYLDNFHVVNWAHILLVLPENKRLKLKESKNESMKLFKENTLK